MIEILIPWEDAEDLRPSRGDIIDFARVGYTHHAVYVGNGNVVHKTGKSHSWKAKIKCESLISVADNDKVRVNNHKMGASIRFLSARSPRDIVDAAMEKVGTEEDYTVYDQNCEEFATRMRYGVGWSSQANNAIPFADAVSIPRDIIKGRQLDN